MEGERVMIHKTMEISHTAAGGSMNKHRILMIVLMTATVCVMSVGVGMRLFNMFLEMNLGVPLRIAGAKEGMGEEAAA